MDDYRCSRCGRPTQPQLCEAGVSASCCEESALLVMDEFEPSHGASGLRQITEDEERDLAENLWTDEQADWTPAMRARHNVNNRDS